MGACVSLAQMSWESFTKHDHDNDDDGDKEHDDDDDEHDAKEVTKVCAAIVACICTHVEFFPSLCAAHWNCLVELWMSVYNYAMVQTKWAMQPTNKKHLDGF